MEAKMSKSIKTSILIRIDRTLHKKLKIRAINENKTLQKLVNEILERV